MDYSKIKLPCTLQRIIDGDTIIVTIDHLLEIYSKNAKIRFSGINAPERKTPEGKISKSALESKLASQELMISFTKIRSKVD
jgi:endonuclease YncB( thermonuclease family)